MKIEKLTDNKIRVIISSDDLEHTNIDLKSFFTMTTDSNGLFFTILKKAEEEVDFYTDGCKLLIESFLSSDDVLVFMITKFSTSDSDNDLNRPKKKRLITRRKGIHIKNKQCVYSFDNFDNFCDFCSFVSRFNSFNCKKIAKKIFLYFYNDTYYLVLRDIDFASNESNLFFSSICEFAKLCSFSDSFFNKLIEHGEMVIKNNAISVGIKYF